MSLSKAVRTYVDMCEKPGLDAIRILTLKQMYTQYGVDLTDEFIGEEMDYRSYQEWKTKNRDAIAHQEDLDRE